MRGRGRIHSFIHSFLHLLLTFMLVQPLWTANVVLLTVCYLHGVLLKSQHSRLQYLSLCTFHTVDPPSFPEARRIQNCVNQIVQWWSKIWKSPMATNLGLAWLPACRKSVIAIRSHDRHFVMSPTHVCFRFERRKHVHSEDSLSNVLRGPASIDLGQSRVNKKFPIK